MSERLLFQYKDTGEVIECTNLKSGRVDSEGVVVRAGYPSCPYKTHRKAGYTSNSFCNFKKHTEIWNPITEEEMNALPDDKEFDTKRAYSKA